MIARKLEGADEKAKKFWPKVLADIKMIEPDEPEPEQDTPEVQTYPAK